ncbi:DUF2177 family protein [Aestuariibacter sp. A3R04]|uniref:DUF2177 family protein n=1 Tax=Aestuariibacter sp. A3R04 TaxID=2841571 RepID=UPI001C08C8B9|nr:DUF2177 family protein [Aestuariibacter sp. A3R04]MBU3020301.1 DUF2177 family protein [Aestuariibacter sp. A3R04]
MNISVKANLAAYFVVLALFAVLDGFWLGVLAMPWYQTAFDGLLREEFITWPWLVFYLLYCASIVFLAIRPYAGQNLIRTCEAGFVLGATAYGTYNLTCYSILIHWPLTMTIIDWIWGTCATTVLAAAGGWTMKKIHRTVTLPS